METPIEPVEVALLANNAELPDAAGVLARFAEHYAESLEREAEAARLAELKTAEPVAAVDGGDVADLHALAAQAMEMGQMDPEGPPSELAPLGAEGPDGLASLDDLGAGESLDDLVGDYGDQAAESMFDLGALEGGDEGGGAEPSLDSMDDLLGGGEAEPSMDDFFAEQAEAAPDPAADAMLDDLVADAAGEAPAEEPHFADIGGEAAPEEATAMVSAFDLGGIDEMGEEQPEAWTEQALYDAAGETDEAAPVEGLPEEAAFEGAPEEPALAEGPLLDDPGAAEPEQLREEATAMISAIDFDMLEAMAAGDDAAQAAPEPEPAPEPAADEEAEEAPKRKSRKGKKKKKKKE